jgi:hypothetical protein
MTRSIWQLQILQQENMLLTNDNNLDYLAEFMFKQPQKMQPQQLSNIKGNSFGLIYNKKQRPSLEHERQVKRVRKR